MLGLPPQTRVKGLGRHNNNRTSQFRFDLMIVLHQTLYSHGSILIFIKHALTSRMELEREATISRIVPSGKVYKQIFDAQVT